MFKSDCFNEADGAFELSCLSILMIVFSDAFLNSILAVGLKPDIFLTDKASSLVLIFSSKLTSNGINATFKSFSHRFVTLKMTSFGFKINYTKIRLVIFLR